MADELLRHEAPPWLEEDRLKDDELNQTFEPNVGRTTGMFMNRIFVTGGSGFIGTNLMERLLLSGLEAKNYDWRPPRDCRQASSHYQGDIMDPVRLRGVLADFKPDVVVHLAARCDLAEESLSNYGANTTGVQNIIDAVSGTPSVERVVFASSRYVHSNDRQPARDDEYSPFTTYGASKAEGEKIVRAAKLEAAWLILRPTSIWGPWFDVPYKGFFEAVRKGWYLHPRGEAIFKSYGYVGNIVHQICQLSTVPMSQIHTKTFYAADYKPLEVKSWADHIQSRFGAPEIREVPLAIMNSVAKIGDLAKKLGWYNPPLSSLRLTNLRTQMVYDISATENVVGPLPFSLQEGVEQTTDWMRQHN